MERSLYRLNYHNSNLMPNKVHCYTCIKHNTTFTKCMQHTSFTKKHGKAEQMAQLQNSDDEDSDFSDCDSVKKWLVA